jgi:hypothetical protein
MKLSDAESVIIIVGLILLILIQIYDLQSIVKGAYDPPTLIRGVYDPHVNTFRRYRTFPSSRTF